jgi:hypothetical protein
LRSRASIALPLSRPAGRARPRALERRQQRAAAEQCLPGRLRAQARQRSGALHELAPGRAHQQRRAEEIAVRLGVVFDEGVAQRARRHAVGQRRGDETARGDADVGVQVVQLGADQRLVECTQGADLVDRAQGSAAGEGETDAGCRARARHRRSLCGGARRALEARV